MIEICRGDFQKRLELLSKQALGEAQDELPATAEARPAVVEFAALGEAWR